MLLRCFIVRKFMSRNRSTQLARQPSSERSSLAFLMLPVTHLFQQIWVRLCVSAFGFAKSAIGFPGRERAVGCFVDVTLGCRCPLGRH